MKLVPETPAVIHQTRDESRFMIGIPMRDISFRSFTTEMDRPIDDRPCAALAAEDCDWGEEDSLANVPQRSRPAWVKATQMTEEPGDA